MPGGESHAGQKIFLDGGFVSASVKTSNLMGDLRN
uniref:Uncharacterized protein n=1 Tax=Setaria italica TaxID=4555 RepID=K3ZGD4_SETIT